ncbi:hypothetical protein RHMOL_Rhmol06G0041600 [Rhododendron molle]|uniref:Uncharacterized protein n=1 Tax=Rhododendron molle TaxID=49168 RepID=A0ACC0N8M7_RHOML|nr:hypothetical protein RHMOL_Rhmol06G0041600 [Rhododendron molle]
MGSLMGGWDSPVYDPTTVKFRRNKSATKEEIEAYWRSKKKDEEECPMKSNEESVPKEPERKIQRSNSVPLSSSTDGPPDTVTETSLEKLVTKTGCLSTMLRRLKIEEGKVKARIGSHLLCHKFRLPLSCMKLRDYWNDL